MRIVARPPFLVEEKVYILLWVSNSLVLLTRTELNMVDVLGTSEGGGFGAPNALLSSNRRICYLVDFSELKKRQIVT